MHGAGGARCAFELWQVVSCWHRRRLLAISSRSLAPAWQNRCHHPVNPWRETICRTADQSDCRRRWLEVSVGRPVLHPMVTVRGNRVRVKRLAEIAVHSPAARQRYASPSARCGQRDNGCPRPLRISACLGRIWRVSSSRPVRHVDVGEHEGVVLVAQRVSASMPSAACPVRRDIDD